MAPRRLRAINEHQDEEFLSKRWEDFDHSQKMSLGVWGTTWTVRDKTSSERYILHSCPETGWTQPRYRLLQLSRRRPDLFVQPKFLFFQRDQVYVCSEVGGISLAEMVAGTIPMSELHAGAIIKQVLKTLKVTTENGIQYNVKASNIWMTRKS